MIEQIRKLLHAVPFVPFKIRTSDGTEYVIASGDHVLALPNSSSIVVCDDEGLYNILSGPHIVSVDAANLMT